MPLRAIGRHARAAWAAARLCEIPRSDHSCCRAPATLGCFMALMHSLGDVDMSRTAPFTSTFSAISGLLVTVFIATLAAPAAAEEDPAQLVGALRTVFGKHQARAAHAKGIILSGRFAPAPDASGLSEAAVFRGGPVPVTVRFSNSTGIADIPDTDGNATPRGCAIKFADDQLDLVTHSFNGFPAATGDEFGALFRAIIASTHETAKPNSLDKFLDAHPAAKAFLTTQKPPPVSFATT